MFWILLALFAVLALIAVLLLRSMRAFGMILVRAKRTDEGDVEVEYMVDPWKWPPKWKPSEERFVGPRDHDRLP